MPATSEPRPDAQGGRGLRALPPATAQAHQAEGRARARTACPRAPAPRAGIDLAHPRQPRAPRRDRVRAAVRPGGGAAQRIARRSPRARLRQCAQVPRPIPRPASTTRARTREAGSRAAALAVTQGRLRYLPLGGLGEVGINMWALEWERKILVVDAGLMFPQEDMPGIDLVLPDISYLLQKDREVLGIFLTHGHEDHIGGLPFTLKKLNVPVFGTRLTLGLVKPKLKEHRILRESDLREVRVGDSVQLGPFRVAPVHAGHSIPDAVALAIDTPVGRVVYTSDFKLDSAPPDGLPTDMARFRRLGDAGVLLLLSDSTNAEREGHSGSERDLHAAFERIFTNAPSRIVVANFASNIHRIQHLVRMATQFERRVAVVGRSLRENFRTARELGFLSVPDGVVVPLADVDRIPPSKLLLLTAGSQGEPMSALTRFAAQRHPFLNVRKDDWVVISARPIPGNERMVLQTVNNLYRHGARVFYSEVGN